MIVIDVQSGSQADEAGMRGGDIIKEVNHQTVESVKDYTEALRKIPKDGAVNLFIHGEKCWLWG
ncbi:MAG: PDZ domain-containing protein [Desulfosudis oleivorans]|nr:PDZ domain-containing protein [Desulfosudis oleivorans]